MAQCLAQALLQMALERLLGLLVLGQQRPQQQQTDQDSLCTAHRHHSHSWWKGSRPHIAAGMPLQHMRR